jgi:hypothetical protein
MKLKSALAAATLVLVGATVSNAATFAISNLVDTTTDALFSDASGTPMVGGVATLGYFPAGVVISSLADLNINLGSFTLLSSATIGATAEALGSDYNGYAIATTGNDIGAVTAGNPLLGRTLYTIFGNGANLETSTLFGAVNVGDIVDDVPVPSTYGGNPGGAGSVVVVGSLRTFQGDIGFGTNSYSTVNLVPEPSAALLGALGALGLLRRRRN